MTTTKTSWEESIRGICCDDSSRRVIMATENCVVRTYRRGFTVTTGDLSEKLKQGWVVKSSTPMIKDGKTDCVEYILEREKSQ
jgi:hypothetical protein